MGVFIAEKNLQNAEFAIASVISAARENRSRASDKARGRA